MRQNIDIIWSLEKEKLQEILDKSNTIAEVLAKLELSLHSKNYKALNERIKEEDLSLHKLNQNRKLNSFGGVREADLKDVLTEESTYSRGSIKRRLVEENLKEYKCSLCNNLGEWNGQKLILQLDHINGINNDNRLENLRFLCPNCHSQTETYCGKNSKKERIQNKCLDCSCDIGRDSTRCTKCSPISRPKYRFEVSKEELQKLVDKHPMVYLGKMFNVSDNAVKKRCIKLGVDYKKKK